MSSQLFGVLFLLGLSRISVPVRATHGRASSLARVQFVNLWREKKSLFESELGQEVDGIALICSSSVVVHLFEPRLDRRATFVVANGALLVKRAQTNWLSLVAFVLGLLRQLSNTS